MRNNFPVLCKPEAYPTFLRSKNRKQCEVARREAEN
jgi:hypothetical protein